MMNKFARLLFLIFLGLFLTGCSSLTRNVSGDFAFKQPPAKGLVVFSLLTTGSGYQANPQLYYRRMNETRLHRVILENFLRLPGSVGQKSYYGELKVLALAPGTYQYVGFELYRGINTGVLNRLPFAYQFQVSPGKVIYLGRIHFRVHYKFFQMPVVRMHIGNYKTQDLKIFHNYLPAFSRMAVQIKIMKTVKPYNGNVMWEHGNDLHTQES